MKLSRSSSAIFLTLLFSFLCSRASSQQLNFQTDITWHNDSIFGSCLGIFSEAFFNPQYDGLPCLHFRQTLTANVNVDDVEQKSVSYKSFSCAESRLQMHATSEFVITAKVSDGRGQYFLDIIVLPFRRVGNSFERLQNISLNVTLSAKAFKQKREIDWKDRSVLSEGDWFKIGIAQDGVYKIDKSLLNSLGINLSNLNPQKLNIYGNGGEQLPELNSDYRPDDLSKCAIYISGEEDGVFDNSDFILFYGKGPDSWTLENITGTSRSHWKHHKHYYSDSAYYFIKLNDLEPMRIRDQPENNSPSNHVCNSFQDRQFIENELYNLIKSGREFLGDKFEISLSRDYNFSLPHIRSDQPTTVSSAFVIRSVGSASSFTLTASGSSTTSLPITTGTGNLASAGSKVIINSTISTSAENLPVNVTFNKSSSSIDAQGYLDYININATRDLHLSSAQLPFRDTNSVFPGAITLFQLMNSANLFMVWDVTNKQEPVNVPYISTGSIAEWKTNTSEIHEFIAFSNFNYLTPTAIGRVSNQNLHGVGPVDLVIVTAPSHYSAAEELAGIHAAEGMRVLLTTQMEVFNEFSSGNPDVTAIRMLMKMLYDRAQGVEYDMPKNLLLFGDGSYSANRGIKSFSGVNVILFESNESLGPVTSYVSDDYFVLLSDEDDDSPTAYLDAGVGRIPASSPGAGQDYVNKVKNYLAINNNPNGGVDCLGTEATNSYGSWRNVMAFIADDQDGSGNANEQIHLEDANQLADRIYNEHPDYDVSKIYMDAYVQESTPGGERYPNGERAIKEQIENGSLIVTYLGHGGERGWAHERILDINTIDNFSNSYKLPVFLTATCELARFDDPEYYSAGERLAMNSKGGAIALLTTTRVVFAGSNMQMDMAFFDVALHSDSLDDLNLGKINMLTKNGVPVSNSSKPNFSLLGDPALKLRYPNYNVTTTYINNTEINAANPDTIKALQEVEVKGFISDANGVKLSNYNGFIYPTVFDKVSTVNTLNNDFDGVNGERQSYQVFNKIIFKGQASVSNGDFSFKFPVPLDINYNIGKGRISYYGLSGNDDAHGNCADFLIGGTLSGATLNKVGPEIQIFLNDTTFVDGGLSNTSPVLIAKFKDENGINTIANSIGHDIVAILNEDNQNPILLNNYYLADLNTYKSGEARYQFDDLPVGNHNLKIRAWDIHNNVNSEGINFVVEEDANLALSHVLNYPNPFTTSTKFMFEHNQACEDLDIIIQIYTVSGKLVKTIQQTSYQTGFRIQPIPWDGRDDFGDRIGKGVYLYKVHVRNKDGESAEQFEKLVILK